MKRLLLSTFSVASLGLSFAACDQAPAQEVRAPLLAAARGELKPAEIALQIQGRTVIKRLPFFSSGALSAASEALAQRASSATSVVAGPSSDVDLGMDDRTLGCGARNLDANVRVNQDCSFRRQAEVDIAFNPKDPDNLIAGQNDSRFGLNQGGIDWSTDNGTSWGNLHPPFRQRLNNPADLGPTAEDPNRNTILGGSGTLHTYDYATDPAVAFDSQGRAFFGAVAVDLFSPASLLFVTTSPLGAGGSFFLNVPDGRPFVVVEDNDPRVFHDKPLITADRYPASPNRDNVYVTWTLFQLGCPESADGECASPIFGSMSTDHGFTWSTPELVSGSSKDLCSLGDALTGDPADKEQCNFDQGSDPEVLPNGDLVVAFLNSNTGGISSQELATRCHPTGSSTDGTAHLNCASPTRIGADILEGVPRCDFGGGPEECVPGAFIRTDDFPRIAVNTDNGDLFVVWQDYRNGEFDIQLSRSVDGGQTWSPSVTVNPDHGLDHYFPAVDVAELTDTSRVGVSYYRTERVPNENVPAPGQSSGIFAPCTEGDLPPPGATSCEGVQRENSDYVLAGGSELLAPYRFKVLSPVFPPPDGIQTGFNGDYSGLIIPKGIQAHPIWSDTRNIDPYAPLNGVVRDEDVFTDNVRLPSGQGDLCQGEIGAD